MGALTTAIAFFRTAKNWLQRGWPTPEPIIRVEVAVARAAKRPLNGCRIE
jgi:hypothetical protein